MRKRRSVFMICLCLALCMSLAGCAGRTEVGKEEPFIYALNGDRTGLVKISYETPDGEVQEQAQSVLDELKEPSEDIKYTAPIPEEVEVQECSLHGSILDVDFSGEYTEIEPLEEKLVRAAVVQSLLQVTGINAVSFTVEEEPLVDSDGLLVGLMNGDDFVENTGSSPSTYQTDTLTLYFADESGSRLVAEKRNVRYSSNVPKEKLIVEKVMQGPETEGAYPTVNPDANLLSVTTKDGICYVNFDSTFLTGTYDILPELTVYSIVNSLTEGTEVQEVQFTINGESNARYMETVDLSKPLEENLDLIAADE